MKAVICGPGDTNHIGTKTLTDAGRWLFHFPLTGAPDTAGAEAPDGRGPARTGAAGGA
ncbi:hypothetical protein GCM10010466_36130 [Planomonospora alba]|uniref:Uncharacterized protein n=1 Tax=Planomonospora alba TaxID=161354 RepID=A0ABP6NAM7_9ACTN